MIRVQIRRRLTLCAFWFLVAWPVFTALFALAMLRGEPQARGVPLMALLEGLAYTFVLLAPDLLVAALVLIVIAFLGSWLLSKSDRWQWLDPAIVVAGVAAGALCEFPALMRHPAFLPLRAMSARAALAVLMIACVAVTIAVGALRGRLRGALVALAIFVAVAAAVYAWSLPSMPSASAPRDSVAIIGLDSVGAQADLADLRELVQQQRGTWYAHAVSPGLLTNAVWTSILTHRYPHETGIIVVFQQPDIDGAEFNLLAAAKREGYETSAFFADNFLGPVRDLDRNQSAPRPWHQIATSIVKDASVLLPIVIGNQPGTFAYDVGRGIDAMLTASGSRPQFVVGHIEYLHQPTFPRWSQLSAEERRLVLDSPVDALRDSSLDWQMPSTAALRLPLNEWKLRHLQRAVRDTVTRSGYLDPARHNRLVLFSDHGVRRNLTPLNFGQPRFYEVLFATFGVPAHDPAAPISTLDIAPLLGFHDPARPDVAPPIVEYTNATIDQFHRHAATLRLDGTIQFDPTFFAEVGRGLRGYDPRNGRYLLVPVVR